ncbi:uncharacterized protein SPAPADRAFT_153012 [Spathaspora passalidarum NRRL Y-27907]|uniref:Arrestin C-terminal-like domain-containing protein n=1 Tax=Spathaspora passalidarum (strain NRRL Y-27907 / 11-Y1) TaxID=619300 RepID=G3APW8_SPAPN|nr:uncharacterized protein SPAPADRAFT_153012 [Spathaspora passalidarum NRRL Y-27907]EGW32289.1 hypothetical protein SPAPADRAFT_153012 [Spathaspora passalidarum NRRL Y-27907]
MFKIPLGTSAFSDTNNAVTSNNNTLQPTFVQTMHPRSFSFDRIKSKVTGRHDATSETNTNSNRRNSMATVSHQPQQQQQQQQQNQHLASQPSPTRRAQSISFMPPPTRSRSRSISKTNQPTLHLNPFKSTTKELVKQETAQIISKKLVNMLSDLGLQYPIPLRTTTSGSPSKSIKIYVANTNDCLYLPPASSTSFTYEDVENGGAVPILEDDDDDDDDDNVFGSRASVDSPVLGTSEPEQQPTLHSKMKSFKSPNYLCSKIDSEHPIPHTFAVVIELTKESTTIKDVTFEFQSLTQILWPNGDLYNKAFAKESFKIGSLQWKTSLSEADYYINNLNSNEVKSKNITPEDLAKRTREYHLVDIRELDSAGLKEYNERASSSSHGDSYKAGLYVFLLPILLPEHIPASIISINGTLAHTLSVNFNKISERLNRKIKVNASYNLPMVRTPPNFANSIADKPIYVNRVWNDAVHYIITFPKKYVSLGNEHVINVKLVPLVKDVIIKRIKFNVLERITYLSRDLRREYDYDSENPFLAHAPSDKVRERVISLCELRTKNKSSSNGFTDPFKEEVIKCPDNNLLYTCYEPEDKIGESPPASPGKHRKHSHVTTQRAMIASPLDINIALPFLTSRTDKLMMTASSQDDEPDKPRSRRASLIMDGFESTKESSVIGTLETNLINHDEVGPHELIKPSSSTYVSDDLSVKHRPPENIQKGFTILSRALYPDSNYRHIQINHRLQVCFRISKPDPKDNYKMHHYEVVVDTPLILLSSKCNDGSMQLPKYDEIDIADIVAEPASPKISFRTPNYQHNGVTIKQWDQDVTHEEYLPTFEEAVKQPSGSSTTPSPSPVVRSMSIEEDPLSRIPSISLPPGVNSDPPAYEPPSDKLIDEVVSSSSEGDGMPGPSRMKASLSNSFAKKIELEDDGSIDSNLSSHSSDGSSFIVGTSESSVQDTPDLSASLSAPPAINVSSPEEGNEEEEEEEEESSVVYLNENNASKVMNKAISEFAIDDDDERRDEIITSVDNS